MKKSELRQIIREEIQFIRRMHEASPAAEQAKKMGLQYAGFGRWKDKSGKVTHTTQNGKLVRKQVGFDPSDMKKSNIKRNYSIDPSVGGPPSPKKKGGGQKAHIADMDDDIMVQIGNKSIKTMPIVKKMMKKDGVNFDWDAYEEEGSTDEQTEQINSYTTKAVKAIAKKYGIENITSDFEGEYEDDEGQSVDDWEF